MAMRTLLNDGVDVIGVLRTGVRGCAIKLLLKSRLRLVCLLVDPGHGGIRTIIRGS
jgi:hypothetical protein